jgi:hypothetical protein
VADGPGVREQVKADAIGTEWCRDLGCSSDPIYFQYSNYHVPWIVAYGRQASERHKMILACHTKTTRFEMRQHSRYGMVPYCTTYTEAKADGTKRP